MKKTIKVITVALVICLSFLTISCSTTKNFDALPYSSHTLSVEEKMEGAEIPQISMSMPSVYYEGPEWKDRMIQDIDSAENYIVSCFFLGSICDENRDLFEKLEQKANEGVQVYLMSDGAGTLDMTDSRYHLIPLSTITNKNIHILIYNPFSADRIPNALKLLKRDHRKFWVVDGYKVSIGGMNVNYSSMSSTENNGQRDSMYSFESDDVGRILTEDFIEDWNNNSWKEISEGQLEMKKTALSTPIKGWLADQHGNNDNMAKVYSSVISSATENVSMLPFMPAMTDSVFNLIKDATDRGVEINMLIPQDPRAGLASCSRYLTKTYQDLGVHIYFEDFGDEIPPFLHEKLVVVDSRYVLFGSSNFNFRSMDLSNEVVLVADSEQFAQSIQQHFDGLLSHSREVSADKAQEWRTFNNFLLSIMMYIGG